MKIDRTCCIAARAFDGVTNVSLGPVTRVLFERLGGAELLP